MIVTNQMTIRLLPKQWRKWPERVSIYLEGTSIHQGRISIRRFNQLWVKTWPLRWETLNFRSQNSWN